MDLCAKNPAVPAHRTKGFLGSDTTSLGRHGHGSCCASIGVTCNRCLTRRSPLPFIVTEEVTSRDHRSQVWDAR
jgi:hypothetical protein